VIAELGDLDVLISRNSLPSVVLPLSEDRLAI
jgi:hypothetical protein